MTTAIYSMLQPTWSIPSLDDHKGLTLPTIPTWNGLNNIQIISPVDNPTWEWLYGRTNNHLARITRQFPHIIGSSIETRVEPKREVIWLTGIMHRNPFGMIDFANTFNQEYWATFTFFDNPKVTYDVDRIADQVIDYLAQLIARDSTKEFVLCGASAGEILARRVYEKLNTADYTHILKNIIYHFSVCGVSTFDNVATGQRLFLKTTQSSALQSIGWWLARMMSNRVNDILGETWLMQQVGDNLLAPVNSHNSEKLQQEWNMRHPDFVQDQDMLPIGEHLNRGGIASVVPSASREHILISFVLYQSNLVCLFDRFLRHLPPSYIVRMI